MNTTKLLRLVLTVVPLLLGSAAWSATIWSGATVPAVLDSGPDDPVEVGVAFYSDTNGYVAGVRFYKAIANAGTHSVHLWSVDGTLLASAGVVETDSGWQQGTFDSPVGITAGESYVASYHANFGHYSDDQLFFTSPVDAPPLHVAADLPGAPNGRYAYGTAPTFPESSWRASNYWVDAVFTADLPAPPTLTSISLTPSAQVIAVGATVRFSALGAYSDASSRDVTSEASWTSSNPESIAVTAPGVVQGASPGSGTISAALGGTAGTATVSARSSVGIFSDCAVPATLDAGPDDPVELGVRFRSEAGGVVTGVRFYKAAANTGPHVASLWTGTGTLLATASFTNETASGWQLATFANPVVIAPNATYVASYHTGTGHYSLNYRYFAGAADNPPLHAPADGQSAPNGVFAYGPGGIFPASGWNASNYWVDVVFSVTAGGDMTAPTVTSFEIPASVSSNTVAVPDFTAADDVGVTGYLITESSGAPTAYDPGWSPTPPTSYTFASAGNKTLYAWAVDAAGNVSASRSAAVSVVLEVTGPEPEGWYAGDMHVHRSCGGSPEDLTVLFQKLSAQNLSVISLLADMGNGEVKDPVTDLPKVTGADDSVSTGSRIVHWDAEWHWDPTYSAYRHHALAGHLVSLGLTQAQQTWQEYAYPILDLAHRQNAIAGFAHLEYLDNALPQQLSCCLPIEYPIEVALGAADFISEDVDQGGRAGGGLSADAPVLAYYRLLNTGFRPGLAAGTDYPCNDGSPPGTLLTYVQLAGPLSYQSWIDGIAKGRTVVSRNGHREFLDLTVNGSAKPGDEIALPGGGTIPVVVQWSAVQNYFGQVEVVYNGVVVASQDASVAPGVPMTLQVAVQFTRSGWVAARRMGSDGHYLHTAAVFVIVDGAPVRANAGDAQFYLDWIDSLLVKTSIGGEWNWLFQDQLDEAQARYRAAREVYQTVLDEATLPVPGAGGVFTGQAPKRFDRDAPYELGTRFFTDVSGQISGVRIYTGGLEGGIHEVRIWRAGDAILLAGPYAWDVPAGTVGWRTFRLPAPLPVQSNTDYIVSISNSSDELYPSEAGGFDAPVMNGHLHTYVGSGVYTETLGDMPTLTWRNSNYFRDVIFEP